MITDNDIAKWLGSKLDDNAGINSNYTADEIRMVSKEAYKQGQIYSTHIWAWWKNGVQYVGNGVYSLTEALKFIEREPESFVVK